MKEANLEVDVSLLCSTYINMWFDHLGNMLERLIITRVWTTGMYSRKPKTWISLWRPLRGYHVLLFSWVISSTPAILINCFTIPEDAMPWWCAWYLQTTCPPQQIIRHQYNHFQQSRDRYIIVSFFCSGQVESASLVSLPRADCGFCYTAI